MMLKYKFLSEQQKLDVDRKRKEYFDNLRRHKEFNYKNNRPIVLSTIDLTPERSFKETYHIYINSDFWKQERLKFLKKHKKCCICSNTLIELHHINYERVFSKIPSKSDDIVPLCRQHHQEFHDTYGVKTDMRKEWSLFKIKR